MSTSSWLLRALLDPDALDHVREVEQLDAGARSRRGCASRSRSASASSASSPANDDTTGGRVPTSEAAARSRVAAACSIAASSVVERRAASRRRPEGPRAGVSDHGHSPAVAPAVRIEQRLDDLVVAGEAAIDVEAERRDPRA